MLNPDLVKFLQALSKSDKKNLTEKALKTSEECGEIARVVLPYQSAFATTHRFVERSAILEECADTMTCCLSIAFDLGYTPAEIEQMVAHKAKKWAELQVREANAKWPVPFEIHVTVKDAEVTAFRTACMLLGVKPLLLDLQDKAGATVFKDLQTSQVHLGNNTTAYAEMLRVSSRLKEAGFNVVREKIEAAPWHPAAPSQKHANPKMPTNCYFECHIAVLLDEGRQADLRSMVEGLGMHLSRNVFKRIDENRVKLMATYRKYDGVYEDFQADVEHIEESLRRFFDIEKAIVEFSVYDTKVSHDASWLTASATTTAD
jgi:hypothetical protein